MANKMRLIDADKLESKLREHHDLFVDGVGGFRYLSPKDKARVDEITNCIAEVINAPTVDAVPVVHGRWEPELMPTGVEYTGYEEMTVQTLRCSECGIFIDVSEGRFSFCPYCGAKMDGGSHETD